MTNKADKRILKELGEFERDPPIGCSGGLINKSNIYKWEATIIGPIDSPYSGGIFKLLIVIPENYPFKPPRIKFTTPIFHPNINKHGAICLDVLNKSWSPVLTVSKTLLSIMSLLNDPNPNDPLDKHAAQLYLTDKEKYNRITRNYTLKHASG